MNLSSQTKSLSSPPGWHRRQGSVLLLLLLLSTVAVVLHAAPLTTETQLISIDMGHESMKVSSWRVTSGAEVLVAGSPPVASTMGSVGIVLNDQTNRKSPPCIAFRYLPVASHRGDATGAAANDEDATHDSQAAPLHPPTHEVERVFAEQAQALEPRFPLQVICSPAQLLGFSAAVGETSSNPYALTAEALAVSYSFQVEPQSSGRNGLGVFIPFNAQNRRPNNGADAAATSAEAKKIEEGTAFTAEELTAMLYGYARRMAEKADAEDNSISNEEERLLATSPLPASVAAPIVPYAALTIPVSTTVAERQAMIDAAAMSGLRVLRLVHSTTGAVVQLAYMKAEQVLTDTPQHVMVYDMGSQHAEVAIYELRSVAASVTRQTGVAGTIELKALIGNHTLGGVAFDECIAAQWDKDFFDGRILRGVAEATSAAERREAAKQRLSLLRAAHRAKEILSVNREAHVTMDGIRVGDDVGKQSLQLRQTAEGAWVVRLKREDFEQQCRSLFDAAVDLRDQAIALTNGTVKGVGSLHRFEVVGGGTRIPQLLTRLSAGYRSGVVDRTLNGDEAPVLGTTLLAAGSAPRALELRSTSTLPQYRVSEWLTNHIYLLVGGSDSTVIRRLFEAQRTTVPDKRRIHLTVPLDTAALPDLSLSLLSGQAIDDAFHGNHGKAPDPNHTIPLSAVRSCPGCYMMSYTVANISAALTKLQKAASKAHGDAAPVTDVVVKKAEVIVEAIVTNSGIPHLTQAILRVTMMISRAAIDAPTLPASSEQRNSSSAATEAHDEGVADAESKTAVTREEEEEENEGAEEKASETTTNSTETRVSRDTTTAEAATSTPTVEVVTRVATLRLRQASEVPVAAAAEVFPTVERVNMGLNELSRSRQRVQQLQRLDDARLRLSTLRNEVESVLVWLKEQPEWSIVATPEDTQNRKAGAESSVVEVLPSNWQATVSHLSEWLDDEGETATASQLQEKLQQLKGMRRTLQQGR